MIVCNKLENCQKSQSTFAELANGEF